MRAPVVDGDDRLGGADPHEVRRHQQHGRGLGARDGDVLRDHLAEQHVEHDDDRDRDDERHRVQHRVGDADRMERRLEQVRHGRLTDAAQQNRAHRDAQLGAGQHQRQVLAGPDDGHRAALALFGKGFQSVTARGYQGELRGDEECVGAQEQHGQHHAEDVTHRNGSLPRRAVPAWSARADRSDDRPCRSPWPASARGSSTGPVRIECRQLD